MSEQLKVMRCEAHGGIAVVEGAAAECPVCTDTLAEYHVHLEGYQCYANEEAVSVARRLIAEKTPSVDIRLTIRIDPNSEVGQRLAPIQRRLEAASTGLTKNIAAEQGPKKHPALLTEQTKCIKRIDNAFKQFSAFLRTHPTGAVADSVRPAVAEWATLREEGQMKFGFGGGFFTFGRNDLARGLITDLAGPQDGAAIRERCVLDCSQ